ncbi:MAG: hypothetical protein WAM44_11180 [Chthoniobacterales bacterium]
MGAKRAAVGTWGCLEHAGESRAHYVNTAETALPRDLSDALFRLLKLAAGCLNSNSVDVLSRCFTNLLLEPAAEGAQTHAGLSGENLKGQISSQIFGDPDLKFPQRFSLCGLTNQR